MSVSADNAPLVFSPLLNKAHLEEKMLVFLPGGNVATEFYNMTVSKIQAAANLKLWVIVPAMPSKLCIRLCTTPSLCSGLQSTVQKVVTMAKNQGYQGPTAGPDVFMSGHSLGGVCAATLIQAYQKTDQAYGPLVVMGSYVSDQDVANWPVPVLTLGAELDGGLGRPGMLTVSLSSSDSASADHGGVDSDWQLTNKPVVILPGIDHSSFCPGFHVPGDVWPAEVDDDTATTTVGGIVASFLHLHSTQPSSVASTSISTLRAGAHWMRGLLSPMLSAFALEVDATKTSSPWCEKAQHVLAGLRHEADDARLMVAYNVYKTDGHEWEHTHVGYEVDPNTRLLRLNISGHNQYYSGITTECLVPASDIGCKLASADRVAQQLNVSSADYDASLTCKAVNQQAADTARQLLKATDAGKNTLARFDARGRPLCFEDDFTAPFNIGPLFVDEHMSIKDNGTCLVIHSLKLGPLPLDSKIFPGVHYCKFLSPARVLDYMMTDSLKKLSGCLNTDPSF